MGKRKHQGNSTSSISRIDKVKTRSSTIYNNEREKLLNHIDSCERKDVRDKTVRTFKYNATSTISRRTVKTITKFFNKGLFNVHKFLLYIVFVH